MQCYSRRTCQVLSGPYETRATTLRATLIKSIPSSSPVGQEMWSKILATASDFRKRFREKVIKTAIQIFHQHNLDSALRLLRSLYKVWWIFLGAEIHRKANFSQK